jgi:Leucine-rich repeat (LRR) protein
MPSVELTTRCSFSPGLTALCLEDNKFRSLPPAIAAATNLLRLGLQYNKLSSLPDGDYLTGMVLAAGPKLIVWLHVLVGD